MFVSKREFNAALGRAKQLLKQHGLWTNKLAKTDVDLVWLFPVSDRNALGLCYQPESRHIPALIEIPRFSVAYWHRNARTELLSTILHEYGHAYAHSHPRKVAKWDKVCEASYEPWVFDRYVHVTPNACISADEDFCETFAGYCLRRKPLRQYSYRIRCKFAFIKSLAVT